MKKLALMAAVVMASTLVHAQTTLTGKWQGETDGGASIALDLTVKGTSVSGTLIRNEQSTTITDGKVEKDTLTFKATINERAETFSGRVEKDHLKLWLERQGPEKAVTLTRVKSK
jgi:hypothetical protein